MSYLRDIETKFSKSNFVALPDFQQTELMLELSNICNHRCVFCQNRLLTRKKIQMNEKLVYRLLHEAAGLGIKRVGMMMTGEPFVSKHLAEYIAFAKEAGFEYVFITTNGALATPQKASKVFDAGLDSIKFSINAGSRETYCRIHGRDDYEVVLQNLEFAHSYRVERKLHYRILSSYVATRLTVDEIDRHYERIKSFVDDFVVFEMNNRAGQNLDNYDNYYVKVNSIHSPVFRREFSLPCAHLFKTVCITCEGYLTLCCAEAMNLVVIEDLNQISLKDAWYSERMMEMRKKHIKGTVEGTPCYNCIHNIDLPVEPLNEELYLECQAKENKI